MGYQFREWLGCPACGDRDDVSMLAHKTNIVLECYACGETSEYVVGDDISIRGLDVDAIQDVAADRTVD